MTFHSASRHRLAILPARRAFTLVELMVVVAIIAALLGILFPVIARVRETAREADTRSLIVSLEQAFQAYYQDFNAYPGPLAGAYLAAQNQSEFTATGSAFDEPGIYYTDPSTGSKAEINTGTLAANGDVSGRRVTGNENAVLGLLGGLAVDRSNNEYTLRFDPALVGEGAMSLNRVNPKRYKAYLQNANLSKGKFDEGPGAPNPAKDTVIPEFLDRWPGSMPLLIARARVGGRASTTIGGGTISNTNNPVVVNVQAGNAAFTNGQYNLAEITPYTQSAIGANTELGTARKLVEKDYKPAGTWDANLPHGLRTVSIDTGVTGAASQLDSRRNVPFVDAFSYLMDPSTEDKSLTGQNRLKKMRARKLDGFIIISAGKDRVYGTADDITNFGSVLP